MWLRASHNLSASHLAPQQNGIVVTLETKYVKCLTLLVTWFRKRVAWLGLFFPDWESRGPKGVAQGRGQPGGWELYLGSSPESQPRLTGGRGGDACPMRKAWVRLGRGRLGWRLRSKSHPHPEPWKWGSPWRPLPHPAPLATGLPALPSRAEAAPAPPDGRPGARPCPPPRTLPPGP